MFGRNRKNNEIKPAIDNRQFDLHRAISELYKNMPPALGHAAIDGDRVAQESLVHAVSVLQARATAENGRPEEVPTFFWDVDRERSDWIESPKDQAVSLRAMADGCAPMSYEAVVDAGGGGLVDEERGFKPIERFAAELSVKEGQNPFVSIKI